MGASTGLETIRQGIDAQIRELQARGVHPTAGPLGSAESFGGVGARPPLDAPAVAAPVVHAIRSASPVGSAAPGAPPPLTAAPASPTSQARADQQAALQKREMQAKLENRLTFLVDLRQKLDDDPELFNFVDSMIANQVRTAEKRQRTYSAVVTTGLSVISLVVGWLLSALSPAAALAHMLGH